MMANPKTPRFGLYLGMDYSGATTADKPLPGLRIYAAEPDCEPVAVDPPTTKARNWTRRQAAEHIVRTIRERHGSTDGPAIIGIDHAFSFSLDYFEKYALTDWNAFLADFHWHWPTHQQGVTVEDFRGHDQQRTGHNSWLRLTDRWSSSAKSAFLFDVNGQVAKSTHAGIPWLAHIRKECGKMVHFWPFDGWAAPESASVIAEVYPSIFRNRYPRNGRSTDEQDAFSIARWLSDMDANGFLDSYFHPPLTAKEQDMANLEGWILGIC